jgi:hypothetical protein
MANQILVLTLPGADRLPSRYKAALPHHWQRGLSYFLLEAFISDSTVRGEGSPVGTSAVSPSPVEEKGTTYTCGMLSQSRRKTLRMPCLLIAQASARKYKRDWKMYVLVER